MSAPKRILLENRIYFITTKTYQNIEYFKEPIFCGLLVENLRVCKKLKQFKLYRFCVLYDHLHLLLKPVGKYNISQIMHNLKRVTSLQINQIINSNVGENIYFRLRGHYQNRFYKKYGYNQSLIPQFKWQKSFYDHIIRSENDFYNHYRYTANNFQKHNLPKNWKYTSLYFPDLVNDKL